MSRHLIVDGYNVLYAWERVAPLLAGGDLESARDALLAVLGEYEAQTGTRVSVIFDSSMNALEQRERHGAVQVIYAPARRSADAVIERLVYAHGDRQEVTVVTSDGAIRSLVRGLGAGCLPAPDLLRELARASQQVSRAAERSRQPGASRRLEGRVAAGARSRLEEMRLGSDWSRRRRDEAERAIREAGVVAIIRTGSPEAALEAARAAHRGGFRCIEITTSVPDFDSVLGRLATEFPRGVLFGAGTVLSPAQAAAAHAAGARFAVSPVGLPEIAAFVTSRGMLAIPAGLTPTEVWRAVRWGAPLVKVFPLGAMDGPRHLRALRRVFPETGLLASGGANPDNVDAYMTAGAAAVSAAAAVFEPAALSAGDWGRVEGRAREMVAAVARAHE